MRYYPGVHKFYLIAVLYAELGWFNLSTHFKVEIIRYCNRLIRQPEYTIAKQIFFYSLQHPNNRWCNRWKKILIEIGMKQEYESVLIVKIRFVKKNCLRSFN